VDEQVLLIQADLLALSLITPVFVFQTITVTDADFTSLAVLESELAKSATT